jgi:hypothetical protein
MIVPTHPYYNLLTEVRSRPHLLYAYPTQFSELKRYFLEFASIRPPFKFIHCDIQTDGYQAYLCCNPEVTSGANISGTVVGDELKIFPGIERQSLLILKVHQNLVHQRLQLCTWRLHLVTPLMANPLVTPLFQLWLPEADTRGLLHSCL